MLCYFIFVSDYMSMKKNKNIFEESIGNHQPIQYIFGT